jgi:hypothetical protein
MKYTSKTAQARAIEIVRMAQKNLAQLVLLKDWMEAIK